MGKGGVKKGKTTEEEEQSELDQKKHRE